jgi:hypothetical protein
MNRCLALLFAVLCASLSVASACTAAQPGVIDFTLRPAGGSHGELQVSFSSDEDSRRGDHSWSTGFPPSQLIGLDVSGFRGGGTRPLHFAVIRDAGRLNCAGQGGNSYANGTCSFTPDAGYGQFLESRGIVRPTNREWFALMALDVRRDLVAALATARYPTPTIDNLLALTAVGVTPSYIAEMSRQGYRPASLDKLIELRALSITPSYIADLAKAGYGNLDPDELVQLKALNIMPAYVEAFNRMGYRNLPVSTLVQLKALDITPEFVRSVDPHGGSMPPVDELVQGRIFGRRN